MEFIVSLLENASSVIPVMLFTFATIGLITYSEGYLFTLFDSDMKMF